MDDLNVTRADLARMEMIASASSWRAHKRAWTRLGVFYRHGFNRPIVATVEGLRQPDGPLAAPASCFSFKFVCVGTIERAIGWFDQDSELTDTIAAQLDGWEPAKSASRLIPRQPTFAHQAVLAQPIGYRGPNRLTDVALWLYPVGSISDGASRATLLERDFGINRRTALHTLNQEAHGVEVKTAWLAPFVAALRFFDRDAWAAATSASPRVDTSSTVA